MCVCVCVCVRVCTCIHACTYIHMHADPYTSHIDGCHGTMLPVETIFPADLECYTTICLFKESPVLIN